MKIKLHHKDLETLLMHEVVYITAAQPQQAT
jgi:hypothetical protein